MNSKIILVYSVLIFFVFLENVESFWVRSKGDKSNEGDILGFTPAPKTGDKITHQKFHPKKKAVITEKCKPCPNGIKCVPYVQCPAHVTMKNDKHPQMCALKDGTHGLCCTTGQKHIDTKHTGSFRDSENRASPSLMSLIVEEAKSELNSLIHSEAMIADNIQRGQPEFAHNMVFRSPHAIDITKTIALGHQAIEEILASRIFMHKKNIPIEEFQYDKLNAGFEGTPLERSCKPPPHCPPHPMKYRTDDGTCNHPDPAKAFWGAAGHPMMRLLPPAYEDGIWAPRLKCMDGTPLSSPRDISRVLFEDVDRPHEHLNLLVMQFGQFISHDVTQSASITLGNGKGISCCTKDGSDMLPPHLMHYACLPIPVPADDYFYGKFNQKCINFVRSSLAPQDECKMSYGKQLSKVTHFLDASMIYGSDSKTQAELRLFRHGRLRMMNDFGHDLLPLTQEKDACLTMEKGSACFFAGDGRVNQIISLTTLQTLFAREHNRVAGILLQFNPHWSDDLIFQEARRIVIAEYQIIIYKEWLPRIVGFEAMQRFDLNLNHEYSSDYDTHINPSITNEFSSAAFRFGHSTVDGKLNIHRDHKIDEIVDIPEVMFNPARLRQRHFFDEMLKTLTNQPMQNVDSSITKGLSRYLFRAGNPFGLDLAAINIHRGRDHALRSYNDYLEVSGRQRIKDFSEYGAENEERLKSVYKYADDVDLWVGGLFEAAYEDALVGPTFADIIADQFSRFRKGDRYFHEHNPDINPGHFTLPQLKQLRQTTMSRIICDNADHIAIGSMQPHAFDLPGHGNELIDCHEIPGADLSFWKE